MGSTVPTGGRRSKQIRSAARAVREGRPAPSDREGDPELLSLVAEPYSDVDDAHRHLQDLLSAFEVRDDRRAVFLTIYSRMTGAVAQRVRAGNYADPEWVGEYLVAFANLYREAVYKYEIGALESVPDPWQLAFEAADRETSLVIQDAALGVNAHINYDLALALDQVGVGPDPKTKFQDHSSITDVIRDLVDPAQDSLIARDADGLACLDESLGRLDERFTVFSIDECRDSAWRTAVAMNSRLSIRGRWARWINEITSTGAAYLIMSSHISDRIHDPLVELEGSAGDQ